MTKPNTLESLEPRQLFAASFNTELIVNGDAEAGMGAIDATPVAIPGWTSAGGPMTVVQYGSKGFVNPTDPGPSNRGRQFFSGGRTASGAISQTIDLSNLATQIDAGNAKYDLSAWMGGFGKEQDSARVSVRFENPNSSGGEEVTMNGLNATERQQITGLFAISSNGLVPRGARRAVVTVSAQRQLGVVADGYVDNVSLKLMPVTNKGSIEGRVFFDLNGDGRQAKVEPGVRGAVVYVDRNNNRKLDANEPRATANNDGEYVLGNVPQGAAKLRLATLPGVIRASTPTSQTVTVRAAERTQAASFGVTALALVTGRVKWDDGSPFRNGIVFDDANGNGRLDNLEQSVKTNEKGEFSIQLERGSHTIRVARVERVKPLNVSLGSGQVSAGNVMTVPPQ